MQTSEGRSWLIVGALSAALAVALGAFGAHGLKSILEANARIDTFETASFYHLSHSIGIFLAGMLSEKYPKYMPVVGWLFWIGILFFSGSLYVLSITNTLWLGAVAPIGGTAFIGGWLYLAWAAWREKRD